MKFTKMHGCGNDYVYINLWKEQIEDPAEVSRRVSPRHFGIGSDGLITIGASELADFRMRIYNADGSEAEMCGNGIRCVAKYVYDHGMTDKEEITVETGAGVKTLLLETEEVPVGGRMPKSRRVKSVRVDMGIPQLAAEKIPVSLTGDRVVNVPIVVAGREWRMTCISMGNPHAVVFLPTPQELPLEELGPQFENHPLFPRRTNTEFVEVLTRKELRMRVWERGQVKPSPVGPVPVPA